ncbi:MAG: response regulator transcription factor [Amylibacter sp.]|nr:response regulator transcription factor [Amylibacter sp.]
MDEMIKLVILIESSKILRTEITTQINSIGAQQIMECASPCNEHRQIMVGIKSGLLIIGNNHKTDSSLKLIKFCRVRLVDWTILVLDHLNTDESAAEAFAAGADDVLHIPFSALEFKARLKLRLQQTAHPENDDRQAIKNTLAKAKLTQTELEIMNLLIGSGGKIVTRNRLSQYMENRDWVYGDRKYDVHITNIRKKLKSNLKSKYMVKSVRSVGYYIQETSVDG